VEEWVLSGLTFDVGSKRRDYKDFNSKADIDDPSRASNRNLARDIVEEGIRLNPEGKPV
jgi:predicted HD phosphohydrolase